MLDSDMRADLGPLHEYGTVALQGGGARRSTGAVCRSSPRTATAPSPTTRSWASTRDATSSGCSASRRAFAALGEQPGGPQGARDRPNATAGAMARQDEALAAAVPALQDTLRVGYPALGALNAALPTLRAFSREALPGCAPRCRRSTPRSPWFGQAHGLVQQRRAEGPRSRPAPGRAEPRAAEQQLMPFLNRLRALSSCTNQRACALRGVEDPEPRGGQLGPPGARADQPQLRGSGGREPQQRRQHAGVPHPGRDPVQAGTGQVEPAPPPDRTCRRRTDLTCRETQEPPNLSAPGGRRDPCTGVAGREACDPQHSATSGRAGPVRARRGHRRSTSSASRTCASRSSRRSRSGSRSSSDAQAVQPARARPFGWRVSRSGASST